MTALAVQTTEREFAQVFSRLALQLRWLDADEAAIRSYYEALRDIPLELLKRSAFNLANEAGRKYFPTTGEWRNEALLIEQADRRREDSKHREWKLECVDCEDTGWIYHKCFGHECGRTRDHAPHDYVTECFCRPTNRTYQRHHERKVKTA